eukprot:844433_1
MTIADAINVARRSSLKNENDLVTEDYEQYTEDGCKKMVIALSGNLTRLPGECRQYVGAKNSTAAAKEDSKKNAPEPVDPFAGLPPGTAQAGRAAAARGRATHAVLQRKYTRSSGPK